MASEAGQLEPNAFEPIMGWSLFKSIEHLSREQLEALLVPDKLTQPLRG